MYVNTFVNHNCPFFEHGACYNYDVADSFQKRNRRGTVHKRDTRRPRSSTIPIGVANPIEMVEGLVRPLRSSISTAINGNQRSNPRVRVRFVVLPFLLSRVAPRRNRSLKQSANPIALFRLNNSRSLRVVSCEMSAFRALESIERDRFPSLSLSLSLSFSFVAPD